MYLIFITTLSTYVQVYICIWEYFDIEDWSFCFKPTGLGPVCVCPVPCYEFEFQWINLELTDSEEDKYLMTLDWLVTSNQ